nr:ABC transporter ATP-binding protein [Treponema sp.]
FEALSAGLTSLDGVDSLSKTSEYSLDGLELMEVLISVKGDKEIRPQLCRKLQEMNLDLYELYMEKNSLEDVFHALTENPQEAK